MNQKKLIGLVIIIFCWSTVRSQLQVSPKMNINQLLNYAIENSHNIKEAKFQYQESLKKELEVKSDGYPQLSGQVKYQDYFKLPTTVLPGEMVGTPGEDLYLAFGKKHNLDIGVSFSQLLFSLEYISGVKAAKIGSELRSLNKRKTEQDVIHDLFSNYYDLLAIYKNGEIINSAIASLQETRKNVKAMVDGGMALQTDLDRIDVNLADLAASLNKIQYGQEIQFNNIKLIAGIMQNKEVQLDTMGIGEVFNLSGLHQCVHVELDCSKRIEYQMLDTQVLLKDQQIKVEKGAHTPTVALYGSYLKQAMRNEFNIWEGGKDWFDVSLVGVKVNVPIFSGRKTHAKIGQARIAKSIVINQREKAQEGMQLEYLNALNKYKLSYTNCQTQLKSIGLAKNILLQNQLKYKEGLLTLTDLLISENDLRSAQGTYVQNVIYLKRAELEVIKSRGELYTLMQN